MTPYYSDPDATLFLCDNRELLPTLPARSGIIITDPPFTDQTHLGARSNKNGPDDASITFKPISAAVLSLVFDEMGRVSSRWIVSTMDWRHVRDIEKSPPTGAKFIRHGVWTKIAPMPQITADRPGTGWEAVAILHADTRPRNRSR